MKLGVEIFKDPIYKPHSVSLVDYRIMKGAVNAEDTFLSGNQIQP